MAQQCALGHDLPEGRTTCPLCGMGAMSPVVSSAEVLPEPAVVQGVRRPGRAAVWGLRLLGAYLLIMTTNVVAERLPVEVPIPVMMCALGVLGFFLVPLVVEQVLRRLPERAAPAVDSAPPQPSMPASGPMAASATPSMVPGFWDGEGWVQFDGDLLFKRGDGWFYSQNRAEWKEAQHLLTGALPAPPPPPLGMRVQQEMQGLRAGWPTPKEAWRSQDRFVRVCRWLMLLGPVMAIISLADADHSGDDSTLFLAFFGFLALPIAAFYGYLRTVYLRDRKKALVLFVGASILQGLFGRAVNGHIARTQPAPMRMDPDPYSLNRVMRP